jgi:competence protein ComEA
MVIGESGKMLDHWTEREKWFLGLLVFTLFLIFSLIVYLNLEHEAAEATGKGSFDYLDLSVHDVGKPLALSKTDWDGSAGTVEPKPAATKSEMIVVDVKGAVITPGIYSLPQGSRVDDAIKAAGGTASDVDLSAINLAERLNDGAALWIPDHTEQPDSSLSPPALRVVTSKTSSSQVKSGVIGGTGSKNSTNMTLGIIAINRASQEELMELPGIGESKAAAIIQYRQEHGSFRTIQDLMEVKGIGPKMLKQIRDRISLD